MPKKITRTISFYFNEVDTLHHQTTPFVNFCCKETQLKPTLLELDKDNIFKNNDKLLSSIQVGKENYINGIMVFIDEIVIESKLKPTDTYVYRFHDYATNKVSYLSFNDVLKETNKKIKNKYAQVAYDSFFDKIEYSEDEMANILSRMSANTHDITIGQIKSNGDYDDIAIITPLKYIK